MYNKCELTSVLLLTQSKSTTITVSDGKRQKIVFAQKQMISTSERRAEHPFAGQNTKQMVLQ